MPLNYSILQNPSILLVSYQGIVTNDDFLDGYRNAYADPAYLPGIVEISDMRPMTVYDITIEAIQEMVTWLAGRDDLSDKKIRVGVVVNNELHDGVSRLYRAVSGLYSREELEAFADIRSALDWLPVDEGDQPIVIDELAKLAALPAADRHPN